MRTYIACARDVLRVMPISGIILMANVLSLSASLLCTLQRWLSTYRMRVKFIVMNSQSTANCNSGVLKLVPVRPEYMRSLKLAYFSITPIHYSRWEELNGTPEVISS